MSSRMGAKGAIALMVCVSAAMCLAASVVARPRIGILGQGSWCWFADPRAVRVTGPDDHTFVAWIDWRGAIVIADYDATLGSIRTHVIGYQARDDHSSPSILVEPDKRLTVFWSGHDGPKLKFRSTLRPAD